MFSKAILAVAIVVGGMTTMSASDADARWGRRGYYRPVPQYSARYYPRYSTYYGNGYYAPRSYYGYYGAPVYRSPGVGVWVGRGYGSVYYPGGYVGW